MEHYLLSVTTGKTKRFSAGYTLEPLLRKRSSFVFDDPAEAKAVMRKSISAFFVSHQKIQDCNGVRIFDCNGLPQFEDFEPLEYDHMDYNGVQQLVHRILFEPDCSGRCRCLHIFFDEAITSISSSERSFG